MGNGVTSRRFDVRRLLDAYEATAEESRFYAEMDALAASPEDVLSSYMYEPGHFTASAFVVDTTHEHLLLIHHRKLGLWLQPGGHIEPADTSMAEAARREVAEETGVADLRDGVDGLFDVDVHRIPAHGGTPPHLHHDLRFLFVAETTDLDPSPEVADAKWVPLDEVPSITTDRSVLRAARKLVR